MTTPRRRRVERARERFWNKVDRRDPFSCWVWKAASATNGYGRFKFRGAMQRANRVAWWLTHGPVPKGLWVLHHCDNKLCVNPSHLFLGTPTDNVLDMVKKNRHEGFARTNSDKTHCYRGHLFDEANTQFYKTRRVCRICRRERELKYYLIRLARKGAK